MLSYHSLLLNISLSNTMLLFQIVLTENPTKFKITSLIKNVVLTKPTLLLLSA